MHWIMKVCGVTHRKAAESSAVWPLVCLKACRRLANARECRALGAAFSRRIVLRQGRMTVAENQMPEQKSMLVVRAPLSEDGWASIYFSSNDGRQMSEREWWHLKQLIELASKAFVKPEPKSQSAAAGG